MQADYSERCFDGACQGYGKGREEEAGETTGLGAEEEAEEEGILRKKWAKLSDFMKGRFSHTSE